MFCGWVQRNKSMQYVKGTINDCYFCSGYTILSQTIYIGYFLQSGSHISRSSIHELRYLSSTFCCMVSYMWNRWPKMLLAFLALCYYSHAYDPHQDWTRSLLTVGVNHRGKSEDFWSICPPLSAVCLVYVQIDQKCFWPSQSYVSIVAPCDLR